MSKDKTLRGRGGRQKRRIRELAEEILRENRQGLRFTDLKNEILARDNSLNQNTVVGTIGAQDFATEGIIEKPSRGLYRIASPDDSSDVDTDTIPSMSAEPEGKPKEEDFYKPFAEWLTNEAEDATKAISLGGKTFGGKWGTPDVIGIRKSNLSDIIQQPIEIVSAEIKTETSSHLITAFGQAVAYCLFSHRSYLVIPREASKDDKSRLNSLCQIFGLGFVLFDAKDSQNPNFDIQTRPRMQEPDYFYMNDNMKKIEPELFA